MAVNLVDKPDEVRVELVEERQANVYELEVAEADLGKVIGRGGKTARALRTVVQAVAPRVAQAHAGRDPRITLRMPRWRRAGAMRDAQRSRSRSAASRVPTASAARSWSYTHDPDSEILGEVETIWVGGVERKVARGARHPARLAGRCSRASSTRNDAEALRGQVVEVDRAAISSSRRATSCSTIWSAAGSCCPTARRGARSPRSISAPRTCSSSTTASSSACSRSSTVRHRHRPRRRRGHRRSARGPARVEAVEREVHGRHDPARADRARARPPAWSGARARPGRSRSRRSTRATSRPIATAPSTTRRTAAARAW